jgi:hypothetical protein
MHLDNNIHISILNYATLHNVQVQFGKSYGYYPDTNLIIINHRYKDTVTGICSFLHELGHAINKDIDDHITVPINSNRDIKGMTGNILVIEWMAWVTGMKIAQELNIWNTIYIQYYNIWKECWSNYLKHLNNPSDIRDTWDTYIP